MPEIKVATKPVSQGAPGSLTLMRGVRTPRGEQALLLKQGVRGAWMLAELRAIFPLEISPYFGNRWAGREQTGNDRFLIQVLLDLGKPAQAWPHTRLSSSVSPSPRTDPFLLFPIPKTQMSWIACFCPHNCQAVSLQQPQQHSERPHAL